MAVSGLPVFHLNVVINLRNEIYHGFPYNNIDTETRFSIQLKFGFNETQELISTCLESFTHLWRSGAPHLELENEFFIHKIKIFEIGEVDENETFTT